jgi:hypothetical protein
MRRVMYHTTTAEGAKGILQHGLAPQKRGGYTTEYGDAAMSNYYARRPAFLGDKPWGTQGDWNTVLEVDVTGIPLAADIPSVAEEVGLYYGGLVLKSVDPAGRDRYRTSSKEALKLLEPHARRSVFRKYDPKGQDIGPGGYEDQILMEDLAKPGSPAAQAAIQLTGTAAVYDRIPPSRIRQTVHQKTR